ncbi:hypothetical protein [Natrinema sp. SYSU A 869]|uniref:hypothetical protein n=1 Tax=Natrinema sp. SYSU A 869 TaxID=2871694 RepID=UPI001CA3939B|nr:hypothetical protein [Natrinema sp. SYSU A 869]
MDAIITGESERVGLSVIDNNSAEHLIEMTEYGEIKYHECNCYPDNAQNRTSDENEHNNQARQFAKYHVFFEKGYDTLEHTENPIYIDAVRRAIGELSPVAFERYFGALHRQIRSHHEDVERLIELPESVRKPDAVFYEQKLYLGIDLKDDEIAEQGRRLANTHGLDLNENGGIQPMSDLTETDLERWQSFGDDLAEIVERDTLDPELTISAVSGIRVGYPDANEQHRIQKGDDPLDRQTDARVELLPYAPADLDEFREFLDHHLRCQIRDCFVKMGVVPPEAFQVVGFGKFRDARRYDHFEMYPQLHKRDGDHRSLIP